VAWRWKIFRNEAPALHGKIRCPQSAIIANAIATGGN
jgi:hypothetical protein